MATPFITVTLLKVKEGQLANYEGFARGLCAHVEAKEPRATAFNVFGNDDGTEVAGIQVHPDSESMRAHMTVMREYIAPAFGDFLEPPHIMIACGEGDAAREMMKQITPPGSPLTAMPRHIGGFTRSAAAP